MSGSAPIADIMKRSSGTTRGAGQLQSRGGLKKSSTSQGCMAPNLESCALTLCAYWAALPFSGFDGQAPDHPNAQS
jgi:hypothetical protein